MQHSRKLQSSLDISNPIGTKMDAPNVTSVSLDELTFDLSGDNAEAPNKYNNNSNKAIGTFENHGVGLRGTKPDKYILEQEPLVQAQQTETDTDQIEIHSNKLTEENDFEVDIPPLSLFPSSKGTNSDDSDSEFEVPEREDSQTQNSQICTEEVSHATDQKKKFSPEEPDSLKFQPEILTPRDKTATDLTLPLETTKQTNFTDPVLIEAPAEFADDVEPQLANDAPQNAFSGVSIHIPHISDEKEEDKSLDQLKDSEITISNDQTDIQKPDIVTTAEDWEDVQTVEPEFIEAGVKSGGAAFESKPLLTFTETWKNFEAKDYSSVKGDIRPRVERKGFSAFTHMLFGPPKLQADLVPQRDLVFCIASTPFDNDCREHIQVLQTVYRCLTGSKFDCQRYGNHWEEIGFQGRDPATDLRGAGMLALLHLLFFLRDPGTKDLARDVYKLSLHPTQNFPFCVMGINLSRICIQVLREEIYNREINKRKDVIATVNNIYAALYLHLYKLWKQGKTISDSGFVLKDVETYSRKNVKTIFKDLELYEKMKKQQGPLGEPTEAEPSFFSVCKEDQCDTKSAAELY
ncbi:ELMO domain-containing protein 3-like [Elysia marginata]|uniref:ELMO domain-containing protein 3-like n=1 Tax=Elysia marginata TaxID=1093978 RepID=A0AAV4I934_9GAST|nr:ELMO domain-containing protein 3-like [Elysia marginata]